MQFFINILLGITVNFIWGLALLIPYITKSTIDPVLLTAGRYGVYGLLSIVLMMTLSRSVLKTLCYKDWLWAAIFAFTGNVGYYILLILSIRFSDIPTAALILGTTPILFAIYGNIQQREFPFRQLFIPLLFIFVGLISLYWMRLSSARNINEIENLFLGIFFAVLALLLWTWYGVQNARYLKQKQACQNGTPLKDADWSIVVGVCTFGITILALFIFSIIGVWDPFAMVNIFKTAQLAITYIGASLVLGIVVSYYATVLWNRLSRMLPVSLVGQLLVFETVSSLLYAAIVDGAFPPMNEVLSICMTLLGVIFGIRVVYQSTRSSLTKS